MTPNGWTFNGSIAERSTFVETGRIPEHLNYLRTEDGLDVLPGSIHRKGSLHSRATKEIEVEQVPIQRP
jgi:hypothetical protein